MTDVIELIIADHRRILRLASVLDGAGRLSGEVGPDTSLASVWDWLANLIDVHMRAEDEICGAGFGGGGLQCGPDHDDIRSALREARMNPAGTPAWWRALGAVSMLCTGHFRREERESLPTLRELTDQAARRRLAHQWRSYVAAQPIRC